MPAEKYSYPERMRQLPYSALKNRALAATAVDKMVEAPWHGVGDRRGPEESAIHNTYDKQKAEAKSKQGRDYINDEKFAEDLAYAVKPEYDKAADLADRAKDPFQYASTMTVKGKKTQVGYVNPRKLEVERKATELDAQAMIEKAQQNPELLARYQHAGEMPEVEVSLKSNQA